MALQHLNSISAVQTRIAVAEPCKDSGLPGPLDPPVPADVPRRGLSLEVGNDVSETQDAITAGLGVCETHASAACVSPGRKANLTERASEGLRTKLGVSVSSGRHTAAHCEAVVYTNSVVLVLWYVAEMHVGCVSRTLIFGALQRALQVPSSLCLPSPRLRRSFLPGVSLSGRLGLPPYWKSVNKGG